MRYLFLLLLFGCTYDDICPNRTQLNLIENQLKLENARMKNIISQPWNESTVEDITEQQSIIESLEIDILLLESAGCK